MVQDKVVSEISNVKTNFLQNINASDASDRRRPHAT